MDTPQHPLSIESFSYSWLINLSHESSFRTSFDEPNSFIEMDPRMPPSKRFLKSSVETKFDFQSSPSSLFVDPSNPTPRLSTPRSSTSLRKMFGKYLGFLRPLCRRIRGGRRRSSEDVGADHGRFGKNKKRVADDTPRISVAYSADEHWRKSCDSESSIYEAVLHCKRSIGGNVSVSGGGV